MLQWVLHSTLQVDQGKVHLHMLQASKRDARQLKAINVHEKAAAFNSCRQDFDVDNPDIKDPMPGWTAIWNIVDAVRATRTWAHVVA